MSSSNPTSRRPSPSEQQQTLLPELSHKTLRSLASYRNPHQEYAQSRLAGAKSTVSVVDHGPGQASAGKVAYEQVQRLRIVGAAAAQRRQQQQQHDRGSGSGQLPPPPARVANLRSSSSSETLVPPPPAPFATTRTRPPQFGAAARTQAARSIPAPLTARPPGGRPYSRSHTFDVSGQEVGAAGDSGGGGGNGYYQRTGYADDRCPPTNQSPTVSSYRANRATATGADPGCSSGVASSAGASTEGFDSAEPLHVLDDRPNEQSSIAADEVAPWNGAAGGVIRPSADSGGWLGNPWGNGYKGTGPCRYVPMDESQRLPTMSIEEANRKPVWEHTRGLLEDLEATLRLRVETLEKCRQETFPSTHGSRVIREQNRFGVISGPVPRLSALRNAKRVRFAEAARQSASNTSMSRAVGGGAKLDASAPDFMPLRRPAYDGTSRVHGRGS